MDIGILQWLKAAENDSMHHALEKRKELKDEKKNVKYNPGI